MNTPKIPHYKKINILWTGNTGQGTKSYKSYSRDFIVQSVNKSIINGSSDPAFLGDALKYNPEEFLIVSLSSCHMLWFLHLCSEAGIIVENYEDNPIGTMVEDTQGAGYFSEVVLNPIVTISNLDITIEDLNKIHHKAHSYCFIANSVNFKVAIKGEIKY